MRRTVDSDDGDEMEPLYDGGDPEGEEEDDGEALGVDGDEDDAEEEDGQDEYEKDGFIVDDLEEDEDNGEERHKKRRKKKRESEKQFVLDEEDYDLLEDNNIRVHRPGSMHERKKFKRLKKARRDYEGEHSSFYDEKGFDTNGEREIERTLFDGDDLDGPLEDIAEDELVMEEEDMDMVEEDEMADFIVDEEDVGGSRIPKRKNMGRKKKFHSAPGVAPTTLQEAQDIFGDVEELLNRRRAALEIKDKHDESGEWREIRLEGEFEPFIVEEQYVAKKDMIICSIDAPERLQIVEESTGPPSVDVHPICEEAKWIYDQLNSGIAPLLARRITEGGVDETSIKDDIVNFLKYTHIHKFDIPFIAMYRKYGCPSLFMESEEDEADHSKPSLKWHKVLWAIHELDKKWLLLQKRKRALGRYYHRVHEAERRRVYDETRLSFNNQMYKSIARALKAAESEREIDDIDQKFSLHFPPSEVVLEKGAYKRPGRKSHYSVCSKAGLWMFASKFGYSSEQFGEQISYAKVENELEDPKETPEDMASSFVSTMFGSPQAVLEGARHMAAVEIYCEPTVRKHFRSVFFENAVVCTAPTRDGNTLIDSFHELYGVKWLCDKPLDKFVDAQWLLIQKAEEEKLLHVSIKLQDDTLDKLIGDCHEKYLSYGVSKSAQLWNEQRKLILKDAIFTHILPSMEKEARSMLTSRAKNWLLLEYGKQLWDKVSVGPYLRRDSDMHSDEETEPRIMACCWSHGKPATTFVMLDGNGEIVDVLEAGCIGLRSQRVIDEKHKRNDQLRLLSFLAEHNPTVVVLGATNLSCVRLKDDIYEIVFKMVEENPRNVGHNLAHLKIVYGDESLARLYENSRVSSYQVPGHPGIVKRAVALGRYLQNPLAMVAALCGHGREILSWEIFPMGKFLEADEKYMIIEQIMVDVANQVGLDLNLAATHEWLFSPLQFISGMGPRKAASFKRSLIRAGTIFSRKELLTIHEWGRNIFVNAVGFLRVRQPGLVNNTGENFDLLDDTRIHPESYGLAGNLAKEIHKRYFGDEDFDDRLEMAIENLRDRPNILKSFNLDAYADQEGLMYKRETLYAIRSELIHGFQDWRTPYEEPSQDEEFYMISGETENTLAEGRTVQATVRRVQDKRAVCSLESGLTGILTMEDYSDDWAVSDLSEILFVGDVLICKIKSVEKSRYRVLLTCKEKDMRDNGHQNQKLDPYYHEGGSKLLGGLEKGYGSREFAKKHFQRRMIVHPRFQNMTKDQSLEFLAGKEPGEIVIRPSSLGASHLTLTLKIYDGVFSHKDIAERGKDIKDLTSFLRIGKTLTIGEETFEDLDEVIDRYVDPLVAHLKSMLSYRKFRRGTKSEVDALLRAEKAVNPALIVYSLGISHEHPGTFILTYIRSMNPHHEYIAIYPKGFKFRGRMFEDIDRLIAYFKKHINDPLVPDPPSIRSASAMVPVQSPVTGGSSDSAWGGSGSTEGRGGSSDRKPPLSVCGGGRGRGNHPSGVPRPKVGVHGRGQGRGSTSSNRDGRDLGTQDHGRIPKGITLNNGSTQTKDRGNKGTWGNVPRPETRNSSGGEAYSGIGDTSGVNVLQGSGSKITSGGWGDTGRNDGPGSGSKISPGKQAGGGSDGLDNGAKSSSGGWGGGAGAGNGGWGSGSKISSGGWGDAGGNDGQGSGSKSSSGGWGGAGAVNGGWSSGTKGSSEKWGGGGGGGNDGQGSGSKISPGKQAGGGSDVLDNGAKNSSGGWGGGNGGWGSGSKGSSGGGGGNDDLGSVSKGSSGGWVGGGGNDGHGSVVPKTGAGSKKSSGGWDDGSAKDGWGSGTKSSTGGSGGGRVDARDSALKKGTSKQGDGGAKVGWGSGTKCSTRGMDGGGGDDAWDSALKKGTSGQGDGGAKGGWGSGTKSSTGGMDGGGGDDAWDSALKKGSSGQGDGGAKVGWGSGTKSSGGWGSWGGSGGDAELGSGSKSSSGGWGAGGVKDGGGSGAKSGSEGRDGDTGGGGGVSGSGGWGSKKGAGGTNDGWGCGTKSTGEWGGGSGGDGGQGSGWKISGGGSDGWGSGSKSSSGGRDGGGGGGGSDGWGSKKESGGWGGVKDGWGSGTKSSSEGGDGGDAGGGNDPWEAALKKPSGGSGGDGAAKDGWGSSTKSSGGWGGGGSSSKDGWGGGGGGAKDGWGSESKKSHGGWGGGGSGSGGWGGGGSGGWGGGGSGSGGRGGGGSGSGGWGSESRKGSEGWSGGGGGGRNAGGWGGGGGGRNAGGWGGGSGGGRNAGGRGGGGGGGRGQERGRGGAGRGRGSGEFDTSRGNGGGGWSKQWEHGGSSRGGGGGGSHGSSDRRWGS